MQTPNISSSSQYWIDWHKWLVKEIGKANANDTFMRAWQQVGQKSNANQADLRAYAKTQGMNIDGEYIFLSGVADTWQSVNTAGHKIGNSFNIGVILVVLMLLGAVYFLFLKPEK